MRWWILIMAKITPMMIRQLTNATSVNIHLLGHIIWGHIWKYTVEKSQINATNVRAHPEESDGWAHANGSKMNKRHRIQIFQTEHLVQFEESGKWEEEQPTPEQILLAHAFWEGKMLSAARWHWCRQVNVSSHSPLVVAQETSEKVLFKWILEFIRSNQPSNELKTHKQKLLLLKIFRSLAG